MPLNGYSSTVWLRPEVSDMLELELQAAVSHVKWDLSLTSGLTSAVRAPNQGTISPAPDTFVSSC